MWRWMMLILTGLTMAACAGAPSSANGPAPINDPTALLVQYGWTLAGGADMAPFTVPTQGRYDAPAQRLLDASKVVGLDFSSFAGKDLTVQSFPLNEPATNGQPVRGNVLMDGSNVAGAWLSVGETIYALNTKP